MPPYSVVVSPIISSINQLSCMSTSSPVQTWNAVYTKMTHKVPALSPQPYMTMPSPSQAKSRPMATNMHASDPLKSNKGNGCPHALAIHPCRGVEFKKDRSFMVAFFVDVEAPHVAAFLSQCSISQQSAACVPKFRAHGLQHITNRNRCAPLMNRMWHHELQFGLPCQMQAWWVTILEGTHSMLCAVWMWSLRGATTGNPFPACAHTPSNAHDATPNRPLDRKHLRASP